MPTQKEIDALIQMLDGRMSEGSGHINVTVNKEDNIELEEMNVLSGMDCDCRDTACKIPNLPMDDDDEY